MKNVILFSAVTFVMVLIWIGFSIYHNQTSSTVAPNVASQIDPIVARFDTKTLESLRARKPVVVSLNQNIQLVGSVPLLSSQSARAQAVVEEDEEEQVNQNLLINQVNASESAEIIPDPAL